MTRINRYFLEEFGKDIKASYVGKIGIFGSKALGATDYSTNPEEIQSLQTFKDGWKAACYTFTNALLKIETTPFWQDFNGLEILKNEHLRYLYQEGIAEWNSLTEYHLNSLVKINDIIYISLINDNVGNNPVSTLGAGWNYFYNSSEFLRKDDNLNSLEDKQVSLDNLTQASIVNKYKHLLINDLGNAEFKYPWFISEIKYVYKDLSAEGWLECDGQSISQTTYSELFAIYGTTFGGDATNFNLPDLRGKVPGGIGQGAGLTNRVLGDAVGEETHQLTIDELASHSHKVAYKQHTEYGPLGLGLLPSNVLSQDETTSTVGGDQAHNNMQPTLFAGKYWVFTGVVV